MIDVNVILSSETLGLNGGSSKYDWLWVSTTSQFECQDETCQHLLFWTLTHQLLLQHALRISVRDTTYQTYQVSSLGHPEIWPF